MTISYILFFGQNWEKYLVNSQKNLQINTLRQIGKFIWQKQKGVQNKIFECGYGNNFRMIAQGINLYFILLNKSQKLKTKYLIVVVIFCDKIFD